MKALLHSLTVILLSYSALYSEEIPSWATPVELVTPVESKASRVVEGAEAKIIFLKGERLILEGSSSSYSSLVRWGNDLWVCGVLVWQLAEGGSIQCAPLQD